MKVHKPIRLYVPGSIWHVINDNVKTNKENYVYIIHYILYKPARDKRFNDFVPLNRAKLENLLGCKLSKYIDFLINYDLIECDNIYNKGEKSYHYRITPKHKFDCNYFELQPETKLFNNIIKQIRNEKTNYSKLEPFLSNMLKEFMNLQFDYDNALNWISTVPDDNKKICYSIAVNQLSDVRFRYFKRNSTNNRLDTNLTNLKKELRQFIIGDYVSIDLKNSQPFLLSFLFEKTAKILNYFILKKLEFNQSNIEIILNNKYLPLCFLNDLSYLIKHFGIQTFKSLLLIRKKSNFSYFTNLSLFKKWVCEGIFYNEFISKFDNQLTRDQVKQIMFEVLFSRNVCFEGKRIFRPFEKEKKIFSSVFPVLNEMIEALKDKEHNKLAIYLQRMESKIFIDEIAKMLVENSIVPFTIHDSLIIQANQQEKALNIVQSVFKKEIGIVPAFHIEKIKNRGSNN